MCCHSWRANAALCSIEASKSDTEAASSALSRSWHMKARLKGIVRISEPAAMPRCGTSGRAGTSKPCKNASLYMYSLGALGSSAELPREAGTLLLHCVQEFGSANRVTWAALEWYKVWHAARNLTHIHAQPFGAKSPRPKQRACNHMGLLACLRLRCF